MRADKTKALIILGSVIVLGWLFRNPNSLSMGTVGIGLLVVTLTTLSVMRAVDSQRAGNKAIGTRLKFGAGFAVLVFVIGMYAKRQIFAVDDTKMAITDMRVDGTEKSDAWGNPIKKQIENSAETYSSAGSDGVFGTDDDINITFKN